MKIFLLYFSPIFGQKYCSSLPAQYFPFSRFMGNASHFSDSSADHLQVSRTQTIFISFQTMRRPQNVDVFIKAYKMPLVALRQEIVAQMPSSAPPVAGPANAASASMSSSLSGPHSLRSREANPFGL
jgi:Elongator subunit Iki1